jgi:DedD protein
MEKKKILLVTVSVGIFLVVAIGAAILFFTPRQQASGDAVVMRRPVQPGADGTAQGAAGISLTPVYPSGALPVPGSVPGSAPGSGTVPEAGVANSGSAAGGLEPGGEALAAGQLNDFPPAAAPRDDSYFMIDAAPTGNAQPGGEVVINVPRPRPAAAPTAPAAQPRPDAKPGAAPATSAPASQPVATRAPAAATPPATAAPRSQSAPRTAAAPAAAAQPRTAAPSPSAAKAWSAYWVQAGSFSSKNRADSAKETQAAKGITSIVENNELGGKIWYRVRVGPYTSQNEADYWLALIQTLTGFEQSQVWRSPVVN